MCKNNMSFKEIISLFTLSVVLVLILFIAIGVGRIVWAEQSFMLKTIDDRQSYCEPLMKIKTRFELPAYCVNL